MPAFVARYAQAFADVVKDLKLDSAALDSQFADFLATWEGSAELRTFFENPAIPAVQKVGDSRQAECRSSGMQKELRNLLAVLIDNNRIGARGRGGRGLAQNSRRNSRAFVPRRS